MSKSYERGRALVRANAEPASSLLKAIANEHRLRILCHLTEKEYSVGELEEFIGRPISFQVETLYSQEQYDIVLL